MESRNPARRFFPQGILLDAMDDLPQDSIMEIATSKQRMSENNIFDNASIGPNEIPKVVIHRKNL